MKIFITGPTGILGKRVTKLLVAKGHQVVGLTRTKQKSEQLKNMGADCAQINLFNQDELIHATHKCDSILHLATSIPQKTMPKPKDWLLNDKIRTEGTKNLIMAARKHKIDQFIGQSVTALYGQQNGKIVNKQTPLPANQIKMLESALEMENLIREGLKQNQIIIRFGTFYSPDAFHTQDFISNAMRGKLPLIGKGNNYWNFIHADEAARAIVFAVDNFDLLKGETLNITDFKPIPSKEVLDQMRTKLGAKRPLKLPPWLAKMILGKDVFGFLTNSYRIIKSPDLDGFTIQKENFISEISKPNFII